MSSEHFVGRQEAVAHLRGLLRGEIGAPGNLTIQSIEGPGGIGKTCLFDHVFAAVDLTERRYLKIKLDGNDPSAATLSHAVSRMVDSAEADAIRKRSPGYYFPTVDHVLKIMETIKAEAAAEFQERGLGAEQDAAVMLRYLDLAFEAGKRINEAAPISRKFVDVDALEADRPLIEKLVPVMASLRTETPRFFEKLGLGSTALRNAVKENACRPLADALISDITAILAAYRWQDKFKITHGSVEGIDRLLLILDDYEQLESSLGEFLVSYFLPALRTSDFESVVVILGRDQLEATRVAWDQHLKPALLKRLVIAPLSRAEMDCLVESFDVTSPEEKDRAWRDAEGYPFYVQLWIEEREAGGRSAVMLKRFYDRTTRWMSDREKAWLQHTLFLDAVNKRTLGLMLEDPHEADEAFRWFEREGSVRDTSAGDFRVREYLRSRLIDYLRISDPDRCDTLERKGRLAMGD